MAFMHSKKETSCIWCIGFMPILQKIAMEATAGLSYGIHLHFMDSLGEILPHQNHLPSIVFINWNMLGSDLQEVVTHLMREQFSSTQKISLISGEIADQYINPKSLGLTMISKKAVDSEKMIKKIRALISLFLCEGADCDPLFLL